MGLFTSLQMRFFLIYNAKKKLELLLFIQILFIFRFRFFYKRQLNVKINDERQPKKQRKYFFSSWLSMATA